MITADATSDTPPNPGPRATPSAAPPSGAMAACATVPAAIAIPFDGSTTLGASPTTTLAATLITLSTSALAKALLCRYAARATSLSCLLCSRAAAASSASLCAPATTSSATAACIAFARKPVGGSSSLTSHAARAAAASSLSSSISSTLATCVEARSRCSSSVAKSRTIAVREAATAPMCLPSPPALRGWKPAACSAASTAARANRGTSASVCSILACEERSPPAGPSCASEANAIAPAAPSSFVVGPAIAIVATVAVALAIAAANLTAATAAAAIVTVVFASSVTSCTSSSDVVASIGAPTSAEEFCTARTAVASKDMVTAVASRARAAGQADALANATLGTRNCCTLGSLRSTASDFF